MAAVEPISSASVILLRDAPLEVLMILRHERRSFVPNAWAFPGGGLEEGDRHFGAGVLLNTMRITAARELFEEAGVWLGAPLLDAESKRESLQQGKIAFRELFTESPIDLERLVWTSRWITPAGVPKRFDTYFFLACTGRNTAVTVQESEATDITWIAPAEAIERHLRGEFPLVFPTLKNLEAITGFATASALLASRKEIEIPTSRPRIIVENGERKIVLP
ncbi:MAG TPA: NUDIX hydrolase [Thermoanaerobaculia bacterium]|jgi:8-oxo-dGTP pyrophosphatase MutT (NUDIX family)|nr:NUDIX hydrolase [Thermoanaerobaculia bacterium]